VVERGDHVAVAGQLLGPGGVREAPHAPTRREQHHREPLLAGGDRRVGHRVGAGHHGAVQDDPGDEGGEVHVIPEKVRDGLGDDVRLGL
jgi:hypothetical protein